MGQRSNHTFVVGLAGPSGSGKSTVARRAAARLGGHIMSLEVYSVSTNHLSFEDRARQNYDEPEAIDIELLENHIRRYMAGRSIEAPLYDFSQHLRLEQTQHVPPKALLIVEGILALHFSQLRHCYDLAIYLDAPESVCFHRRKVRDITERQRPSELTQWQYETTVLPAARRYLPKSKSYAHHVLDAGKDTAAVEKDLYSAISQRLKAADAAKGAAG
jgi:uridine kinase